ncbi:MAG: energy transducer TonB [Thermodesulfobacteriota bacterium]
MSKEFYRSFFLALGLHSGLFVVLCFSWPLISQSVFSFPRYEVFRVSIIDQGPLPGGALTEDRKRALRESPELTLLPAPKKIAFSTPVWKKVAQPEPAPIQNENVGIGKEPGLEFHLQSGSGSERGQIKAREDSAGGGGTESAKAVPVSYGSGQGFSSSALTAVPRYDQNRSPYYPAAARDQGWQGTVLLKVNVLKDGSVGSLALQRSSGYPVLDRSALKAVRDWKFIPAKKEGQPVEMEVQVPVKFRLE